MNQQQESPTTVPVSSDTMTEITSNPPGYNHDLHTKQQEAKINIVENSTGTQDAAQIGQTEQNGVTPSETAQILKTRTVVEQGAKELVQRAFHTSQHTEGRPENWKSEVASDGPTGYAVSDRGEGHSAGSDPQSKHTLASGTQEVVDVNTANIVVFGETGVGKSSIINLIAGEKIAHTSNDAHGCTFHHERHPIKLGEISCALWDTTGLDEGSEGTVPAKLAEKNLRELMRGLAHSGGIHLVIYCIRGSRLTKALRRNYDLFYVTVCRKKVPVALVVTGLEHQEGEMEKWWTDNKEALRRHGMRFDAHACITAANAEDDAIRKRREKSQGLLCNLVAQYSGLPGWKADSSIMSRFLPLVHTVFRGIPSTETNTRKVTICGSFGSLLPGTTAVWDKSTGWIGKKRYEFLQLDKHALSTNVSRTSEDIGGAGLLVFYTAALVDNRIPQTDIEALKKFYDAAGGQSCPMIVVLRGCDDEKVAWACRVEIASHYSDISAHFVSIASENDGPPKLDEIFESLYMEPVEVKVQKFWKRILG